MKVGIEIPEDLHRRLKVEAARRQVKLKDAFEEAITAWLKPVEPAPDAEFQEQLRIAKEGMVRYRETLRELAK